MRTKDAQATGNVKIGLFTGIGFLSITPSTARATRPLEAMVIPVDTTQDEFKVYTGNYLVEVYTTRKLIWGDPDYDTKTAPEDQAMTVEVCRFSVTADAALALGLKLDFSVEQDDELVKDIDALNKADLGYEAAKDAILAAMSEENRARAIQVLADRKTAEDNPVPPFDVDAARAADAPDAPEAPAAEPAAQGTW